MKNILLYLTAALSLTAADDMTRIELTVNGIVREALLYIPASADASAPLVFVFHGHGGSMQQAANGFSIHKLWPEAVVIYPQGLKTPGKLTDPEGKKTGWQSTIGDQNDRDIAFFDALLAYLMKTHHIDAKRVYATGHSNGGGFTYLLWAARGDVFAAVAPSAALIAAEKERGMLKPKPAMHMAGKKDPLVKFAWQDMIMKAVKDLNGCADGERWEDDLCTRYQSANGTPLVTYIHGGGHELSKDALPLVVKFFKEQQKP